MAIVSRTALAALLVSCCLATGAAYAQTTKRPVADNPVAAAIPAQDAQSGKATEDLSSRQVELIGKVSAYFNQMSSLKGEFVQTSANGSRLRGKFYVKRPGRFRFDYARPSRLVIVSDGRYVAIQDHDLRTDDRWELEQTPLGVLLRTDVNLLRDASILDVQETEDAILVAFEDKQQKAPGALSMLLAKKPALELKTWITKDLQGLDTRIELSNITRVDDFEAGLFKPAPLALDRLR